MKILRDFQAKPGESGVRRELVRMLLLVLLPSFAAIGFNTFRSEGLPLVATTDYTDDILVPCPENLLEAIPIDIGAVPEESGAVVIVDARSAGEYLAWHIPGAISIPHRTIQSDTESYERGIEADLALLEGVADWPIIVCGDARMESGRSLAAVLLERGLEDVSYLIGGCSAWEEAGRPIERAESVVTPVRASDLPPQLEGFVVVDARFSRYYRRGHLPEALNVTYAMLESAEDTRLDALREHSADPILVYGSASRGEGESLARLLAANGWSHVSYLDGGFEAWESAGRPLHGDAPPPPTPPEGDGSGTGASPERRPQ